VCDPRIPVLSPTEIDGTEEEPKTGAVHILGTAVISATLTMIYVPAQPRISCIREYIGPFANGPAQPRICSFANRPAQPRIAAQYEGY
jgi:hypothetical protein